MHRVHVPAALILVAIVTATTQKMTNDGTQMKMVLPQLLSLHRLVVLVVTQRTTNDGTQMRTQMKTQMKILLHLHLLYQ